MAINSMTGFGKGVKEKDGLKVNIEIKSVNHRFMDLNIKVPKIFSSAEELIRSAIKNNFNRGHFDVFLTYEDLREDSKEIDFDYSIVSAYINASKKIADEFFIKDDLTTKDIFLLPDAIKVVVNEEDEDELNSVVSIALDGAIDGLLKMRKIEGENLRKDIIAKLGIVKNFVCEIEKEAPNMVKEHFEKVRQRVQEFLKDTSIDEARILNEVAIYSDKVCVDEEIQRLKSHIDHFEKILNDGGIIGKQLDFVVQEMNRETNTCGSKCNSVKITNLVVQLKNEIEKIREQIQNIE